MKIIVLLAAAALAWPVWAQAPEKAEAVKPAAQAAKVTPRTQKARKTTAKRHQDARHCLQRPNNDAIIRCAEEYL
jgi:hypothetical protein